MAYVCPGCSAAVDEMAATCARCGADFTSPQGWRPSAVPRDLQPGIDLVMSGRLPPDNGVDKEAQQRKWLATSFLLVMTVAIVLLAAISFGFLLIPAIGAISKVFPVYLLAFVLNVRLRSNQFAFGLTHMFAVVVAICVHFAFAVTAWGEMSKSGYFIVAYVVGALAAYLLYLFCLAQLTMGSIRTPGPERASR